MDVLIKLLVLFWGLMMLKVSIIFASKPLKYSIIPAIVILILLFGIHPTGA